MKTTDNQFALTQLRERRAQAAGEIIQIQQRLRYLQTSIGHLDATLLMLDPRFDAETAPIPRKYRKPKLFGRGKLACMCLDALRRAGKPLSTPEVVDAIILEQGFAPDTFVGLIHRTRNCLYYLSTVGRVEKTGEQRSAKWKLP